jgi:hypothetical protein
MRTHQVSVFGVATMVMILLATGVAARLAELALVSSVRLTSIGGGGLLTPDNLAGADHRHVTYALVRLLLPGLLIQAFLVKLVVSSFRGLRITYIATVAVLGMFNVAALAIAAAVATTFVQNTSLHALTTFSPAAIYLSVAISAATLIGEAYVLQGLVEMPVGRYPVLARRAS